MDSSTSLVSSRDPKILFHQMHTLYRISRVNQACYDPKTSTPLVRDSLEHCLMGIWARVHHASSYEQAQEILQELDDLPLQIKEQYKTSLAQANTQEKIVRLAKDRFSSVRKDLADSFKPLSNTPSPPVNRMTLRAIWRNASTSTLPPDELKQQIQAGLDKLSLPEQLSTYYRAQLNGSENLQETIHSFLTYFDENLKTYSTPIASTPPSSQPTSLLNSLYKLWHEIKKHNYASLEQGLKDVEQKIQTLPPEIQKEYRRRLDSWKTLGKLITLEDLQNCIKNFDIEKQSYPSLEEGLQDIERRIQTLPLHLQKMYREEIQFKRNNGELNTLEDLYACVHAFAEDTTSAYAITSTSFGDTGCPKLAEYKRTDDNLPHTCFFKYLSEQTEFDCNRLYSEVLEGSLTGSKPLPAWRVPHGAMLNLQAHTYTNHAGDSAHFTPEQSNKLREIFSHLATAYTNREGNSSLLSEKRLQDTIQGTSTIGVFERIMGANNLGAFFERHYKHLNPEQKEQFWHKIGQIILLDLIGHLDRLVRIDDQSYGKDGHPLEQYVLFGASQHLLPDQVVSPCNFGNLMVQVKAEGDLVFYAIDNNLGDGNPTNLDTNLPWLRCPQDQKRYLTFLKHLFSQKNPEQAIIHHFLKSLRVSIQEEGKPEEYEPLMRDLDSMDDTPIKEGMQSMGAHLAKHVLPSWKHNQDLKDSFSDTVFVKTVQKRLYAITQTK